MEDSEFSNFITSFGATKLLLERAKQKDFLIEALVLYASLVDGLCRIGLVLKEQIINNNSEIDQDYIHQVDGVHGIVEREIYNKSLDEKVISQDIFDDLNRLYDFRNKLIHRFFLSEIDYSKTKTSLLDYEKVYEVLYKIIFDLETQQIKSGIGMSRSGHIPKDVTENSRHGIIKKIGLFNREIVHTLGYTTIEEVGEFSRKNGLMDKCKNCDHYKMNHINTHELKGKKPQKTNIDDLLSKCFAKKCNCKKYSK